MARSRNGRPLALPVPPRLDRSREDPFAAPSVSVGLLPGLAAHRAWRSAVVARRGCRRLAVAAAAVWPDAERAKSPPVGARVAS